MSSVLSPRTLWRGAPPSADHQPDPVEIVRWAEWVEAAVVSGVNRLEEAALATTGNITLSGEQTIDGTLTSSSRVLVKNQTDKTQNGIYVSASGAWARADDANSSAEIAHAFVYVTGGSANVGKSFAVSGSPELGVDDIIVTHVSGSDLPLNSPAFTGSPTAPTPEPGADNTRLATTAFVKVEIEAGRESPEFTGEPTAPTPEADTNNTQIANAEFVQSEIGYRLEAEGSEWLLVLKADGTLIPLMDAVGGFHLPNMPEAQSVQASFGAILERANPSSEDLLHAIKDANGYVVHYTRLDGGLMLSGRNEPVQTTLDRLDEVYAPRDEPPPPVLFVPDGPEVTLGSFPANPLIQGVPASERTGSRSWACWYANEARSTEGWEDYLCLAYSDDDWDTVVEHAIIKYPQTDRRVFDPALWVDPNGLLWIIFSVGGNNPTMSQTNQSRDGLYGAWAMTILDPEDDALMFSPSFQLSPRGIGMVPKHVGDRVLIPIDLWERSDTIEQDLMGKKLFELDWQYREARYISTMPDTLGSGTSFSETYIVELTDGRIMAVWRSYPNPSMERAFSSDGGVTWGAAETYEAVGDNMHSRIWLGRSPNSGRLVICYNDQSENTGPRKNLKLKLSTDEGRSWPHEVMIDARDDVSYPAIYFGSGDEIHVIYDRDRTGAKEINVGIVSEADVFAGTATVTTKIIDTNP